MSTETTTFDLTPTWENLAPQMLELHSQYLIEGETGEIDKWTARNQMRNLRLEFLRMAQAADKWNAHVKAENAKG